MVKFDIYSKQNPGGFECLKTTQDVLFGSLGKKYPIQFKSDRQEDYQRFRSLAQVFDLVLVDYDDL